MQKLRSDQPAASPGSRDPLRPGHPHRRTLTPLAMICAAILTACLLLPSSAAADIITPEQQFLRTFGLKRPSRYADPRWECAREAERGAELVEEQGPEAVRKEQARLEKACLAQSKEDIEAYEQRQRDYQRDSTIVYVGVALAALLLLLAIAFAVFKATKKSKET